MNIHPKVAATGIAGAVTVILVWGLSLAGITVPAEVAAAFTLLIGAIAGYLAPNAGSPPAQDPTSAAPPQNGNPK